MADQAAVPAATQTRTVPILAGMKGGEGLSAVVSQLGSGRANVIDLSPIRDHLGPRWAARRDHVWAYAERFLSGRMSPVDKLVRLNETSLLLSQPEKPAAAAQAGCVRAAADLIASLIGQGDPLSIQLKTADRLEAGALLCSDVDVRQVASMLAASDPGVWRGSASASTAITTRTGRSLNVDVNLQPFWNLRSSPHQLVGYYAHRTLSDADTGAEVTPIERGRLLPADFAEIDRAALTDALKLRSTTPEPRGLMIIPASYLTIANTNARNLLFHRVKELSEPEQKSFSWEVTDTPDGVPEGRLVEVLALVRQICRNVICHLPLNITNAQRLKRVGATISFGSNRKAFTEYELFQLEPVAAQVIKIMPGILLRNVPADLVTVAAFTHATHANLVKMKT